MNCAACDGLLIFSPRHFSTLCAAIVAENKIRDPHRNNEDPRLPPTTDR